MQEIWKDIIGYEGLYQVSNFGRVKSCDKYVKHPKGGQKVLKEKIRTLACDKDGYCVVDLYKNGVGKMHKVHRLVANSFIENNENKPQVNHINGIKKDNYLINLEWTTSSENQKHAFNIGLKKPSINGEKEVLMYDNNGILVMQFSSITKASNYINCKKGDISSVLNGRQKTTRGHSFKYKN
jgi:hypothetical protein